MEQNLHGRSVETLLAQAREKSKSLSSKKLGNCTYLLHPKKTVTILHVQKQSLEISQDELEKKSTNFTVCTEEKIQRRIWGFAKLSRNKGS